MSVLPNLAASFSDLRPIPKWSEWGPTCANCDTDEYRVDGYCSVDCEVYHELRHENAALAAALIEAADALREITNHGDRFPGISLANVPAEIARAALARLADLDRGIGGHVYMNPPKEKTP